MLAVGIGGGRIIKNGQYYTFTHKHLPPPPHTHTNIQILMVLSFKIDTGLIEKFAHISTHTSQIIKLTITLGHLLPLHTHTSHPPSP